VHCYVPHIDDAEREKAKREPQSEIRRVRGRQADLKTTLAAHNSDPDRGQGTINKIAGLEGEIASLEQHLRRL
jgi:hypothetical protein